MKLAKKMLVGALALAMVAALALTAFAADPALKVDMTDAIVGETVTLTVYGTDVAGLESADLQFSFDTAALELVEVKKAYADFDLATGGLASDGLATFSFAYLENNSADKADDDQFCTITFKVLKAGETEIKVHIESWDGIAMPADFAVKVNATEKAPVVTPPAEDESKAPSTDKPADTDKKPTGGNKIPQTGEVSIAIVAGVMAVAAVAFVATRKKDEQ